MRIAIIITLIGFTVGCSGVATEVVLDESASTNPAPIPVPETLKGCTNEADCSDGNVCTTDICNVNTKTCQQTAILNCPAPTAAKPVPMPALPPPLPSITVSFERYMRRPASEIDLKCFNNQLIVLNRASTYIPGFGTDPEPVFYSFNGPTDTNPTVWGYRGFEDDELYDPRAMDISSDGTIAVADGDGGKVLLLNPDNSMIWLRGFNQPTEIAATDDMVYVFDSSTLALGSDVKNKLIAIDKAQKKIILKLEMEGNVHDLLVRGDYLYVVQWSPGEILILNRHTFEIVDSLDNNDIDIEGVVGDGLKSVIGIDIDSEGRIFWVSAGFLTYGYCIDSPLDRTPRPFLKPDTIDVDLAYGNSIAICGDYLYLTDGFEPAPNGVVVYKINR